MSLSREEIERAKFTFSIYDFDGSGKMDAFQLGHALRAMGLYPTLKKINNLGGTIRRNEKSLSVEEFLAIYQDAKQDKDEGSMEDYLECLRSHDKDQSGKMSVVQLGHLLQAYGEKLDRDEVEEIIRDCGMPFDDMVDYKAFLKNLLSGPENRTSPVRDSWRARQSSTTAEPSQPPPVSPGLSSSDGNEPSSPPASLPPKKEKRVSADRSCSDVSSMSDTSGGDLSKTAAALKSSKAKHSSVAPEVKNEPPPVKTKFQQPLISIKTDGLFGKRK